MELPVFELRINESITDDSGVEFISLVDSPAIMKNWIMFSEDKTKIQFKEHADKRVITTPILIPDMPIYRRDADGFEYWVLIRKEDIDKAVKKFFKVKNINNINENHSPKLVENSIMIESWFVNDQSDKSKAYGMDLPAGTWCGSLYFEDETYWNENIKSGKFKGVSIEGLFEHELATLSTRFKKQNDNSINEFIELFKNILSKVE
jgi:hypothetical protein